MSVIKEKTKQKPIGVKKIIMRLLLSVVSGLICAGCIIGAVIYLKPQLAELLNERQDNTIIIQSGNTSSEQDEETDENKEEVPGQSEGVTPADVEAWQMKLYAIGAGMKTALVEVGENKDSEGLIFSTDGQSVIILVANCPNMPEVQVRFFDGVTSAGTVAGYDVYTGMGVVFVKKKDVMPITMNNITTVQWGSTKDLKAGKSVIGIGSPLGESGSVIVGTLTGNGRAITFTDREHGVLDTDIVARTNASGFLLDETGALIGVITHAMDAADEVNWITVYDLDDVTAVVEKLANKQALPYVGINGTTVTNEMNEEYGVPDGVYVNGVVEGSPAMIGNIQAGDVITKINGAEVKSVKQFYDALLQKSPGEAVHITVHRSVNGKYVEMTFEITVGGSKVESRGSYEVY